MLKPLANFPNYSISEAGEIVRNARVLTTSRGIIRRLSERIKKNHLDERGYVRTTLEGSSRLVHRLVAETYLPNPDAFFCVDHIDGDPSNCHVSNLRWCNQQTNQLNRHVVVAKSGFTGVHKLNKKLKKPWVAVGKLNKKAVHLGTFTTAAEAALARRIWELGVGAKTMENTHGR